MTSRAYIWALVLSLSVQLTSAAEINNDSDSRGVVGLVKKLGTIIDSMSIRGLDRRYIASPQKPWQIIVQGNMNQSDLKMKAVIDGPELFDDDWGDVNWESRIKTDISTYTGAFIKVLYSLKNSSSSLVSFNLFNSYSISCVLPTAKEGIITFPPLSKVSETIFKNISAFSSFLT